MIQIARVKAYKMTEKDREPEKEGESGRERKIIFIQNYCQGLNWIPVPS